jgi:MSHA biogenesis protein MshI
LYFPFGKSKFSNRAGIALTADGIAFAEMGPDEKVPSLLRCGFLPLDQQQAETELQSLLKQAQLNRHRLAICLDRTLFNLSLVEAPAVAPSEISQALAWKVKDLIDFPLDQLVLDYVDVPATKSSAAMVYAVSSQEPRIQHLVNEVNQAQAMLERIDIPALALQNLISRMVLADEGVALLNLTHRDSILTLGRGEKLYLSRGVDALCNQLRAGALPAGQLQASPLLDDLLLDVQRSLDYYDSYFVDPPIRHLIIPSTADLYDELIDFLDQNLAVDVRRLDLDEVLVPGPELQLEGEYLGELTLAIGAAMWRQELAA